VISHSNVRNDKNTKDYLETPIDDAFGRRNNDHKEDYERYQN
jgi:hypothetical protein